MPKVPKVQSAQGALQIGMRVEPSNQAIRRFDCFPRRMFELSLLRLTNVLISERLLEMIQQLDFRSFGEPDEPGEVAMLPSRKAFSDVPRARAAGVSQLFTKLLVAIEARSTAKHPGP